MSPHDEGHGFEEHALAFGARGAHAAPSNEGVRGRFERFAVLAREVREPVGEPLEAKLFCGGRELAFEHAHDLVYRRELFDVSERGDRIDADREDPFEEALDLGVNGIAGRRSLGLCERRVSQRGERAIGERVDALRLGVGSFNRLTGPSPLQLAHRALVRDRRGTVLDEVGEPLIFGDRGHLRQRKEPATARKLIEIEDVVQRPIHVFPPIESCLNEEGMAAMRGGQSGKPGRASERSADLCG